MNQFGYTPNEIADMTPEQQFLCFRKVKGEDGQYATCTSLHQARQMMSAINMRKGLG